MNIKVNRKTLLDALRLGGSVAGKSKFAPILNCCKVKVTGDKMVVTSTDTDITIAKKIYGVESDAEHFEFCIIPSDLTTVLATLNDEFITLEVEDSNCTLRHSRGEAKIAVMPAIDFPIIANIKDGVSFCLDSSRLKNWLDSAKDFVGIDPLRPAITGLHLEIGNGEVWCCASNSQKIFIDGYKDSSFEGIEESIIISPKTFSYASSILNGNSTVTVQINEGNISFLASDAKVSSKLIVGSYPKVRQILTKKPSIVIKVNTAEFSNSIQRISLFADKKSSCVNMFFSPEEIKLTSSDIFYNKSCEDSCEVISYSGENIELCTKVESLEVMVSNIESDTFHIGLSSPKSPIIFYEDNNQDKVLLSAPLLKKINNEYEK